MAQAGYTPIQLYYSTTASAAPSSGNLANGELAINITDGKLYYKDNGGTVRVLAGTGGTGVVAGSNTQVQFNNNGVFGASSGLTFDGSTLTANALTVSNAVTLSGGTANGVAYLNGSKVLTTGSALTFDGTNFGVGTTTPGTYGKFVVNGNAALLAAGAPYFYNAANDAWSYIKNSASAGSADLTFNLFGSEAMRLTSTGLGIGTSSPNVKLQVIGSSTVTDPVIRATNAGATQSMALTSGGLRMDGGANILINQGGGTVATIDTSGNLGLGVTPSVIAAGYTSFFVNGSNGSIVDFGLAGSSKGRIQADANGLLLFGVGATPISFYTNSTEQMRLTSTGLGIGTSSPGVKLDVAGIARSNTSFDLNNGTVTGTYGAGAFTGSAVGIGSTSNHPLVFGTNSGERMRLDSSGNLGLGVTPSAWGSSYKALQLPSGALSSFSTAVISLYQNSYDSGTGAFKYINSLQAAKYDINQGAHYWYIAPSGTAGNAISFTQAMTLDASGNLGLGTTTINARVHADGGSSNARIKLSNNTSGRNPTDGFDLDFTGTDIYIVNRENGNMIFENNGAERARIDSSGNLYVGTANNIPGTNTAKANFYSAANTLYVATSDASFTSDVVRIGCMRTSSSGYNLLQCYSGNGSTDAMSSPRMYVRGDGGIGNYQANNVNLSDRREKTNFSPAGSYLDKICAIPIQTYRYIDQEESDTDLTLGVVAQDVQEVAPELVTESNWGTEEEPKMRLSIYQTDLQYALMKCIQEQQAIITALTERIAALEAK